MDNFNPINNSYEQRHKVDVTLAMPDSDRVSVPSSVDTEVVELYDEDAWQLWQDSVFVDDFTNEAIETRPGKLE